MFRAVARRAVASVGALSSAVGGVGTGGSTRAIRRRTFSSGAGGSMDSKIPLMSVALGAAATATAYEAARSLEKPNPTPAARPNPELIPGKSTASKSSKAAAAVEKKEKAYQNGGNANVREYCAELVQRLGPGPERAERVRGSCQDGFLPERRRPEQ